MSALLSPPDQLQREQAVEPTRSVLLSAPAGSGKTGVLLLRYLRCNNYMVIMVIIILNDPMCNFLQ